MALTKKEKTTVAAIGGLALLAAAVFLFQSRDVDTTVILQDDRSGQCVVVDKKDPVAKKDKKITWNIENGCADKDTLVTVGNFRNAAASTASDCLNPTEGTDVVWPFKEDINDRPKRQHTKKIPLTIKKDSDLPGERLTYYFDICTGQDAERKSDPQLVIER